jgi:hypothetical protein
MIEGLQENRAAEESLGQEGWLAPAASVRPLGPLHLM